MLKKEVAKVYEKVRLLYGLRFNTYYKVVDDWLKPLCFKHFNERCFIVGTGPSLKHTNLSLIKDEIMMGVNNLFMGFADFNIKPKYWCVADAKIFEKYAYNLLYLPTTLFLTDGAGQLFLHNMKKYPSDSLAPYVLRPLSDMKTTKEFSTDIMKGVNGGMVTLSCLQIAYYLGFKEVYLLGCDCSSKGKHYDNKVDVKSKDDYWEHFFKLYDVCKKVYEADERKIYNATVGGNLEVFERKLLEDIIK